MSSVRVECCNSKQDAAQRRKVLAGLGFQNFATIPGGTVTTAKVGGDWRAKNEAIVFDDCACILLAW